MRNKLISPLIDCNGKAMNMNTYNNIKRRTK